MAEKALHRNSDLTTTDLEVLGHNPARRSALFINNSDTLCYLNLGSGASTNEGIPLRASGGWYEINLTNPWYGPVHAVSDGATKRLNVTEVSN